VRRAHLTAVENKAIHKEDEYVLLCMSPHLGDEDGDLYWSNEMGWVTLAGATRFSKEESTNLRKPLDGQWINLTQQIEHLEMCKSNHPTTYRPAPELRVIEGDAARQHPEHE
jgi:hypothetical protein